MTIYRGLSSVNREVKKQYRGIGGVNREIKEQYRGYSGVNRRIFGKTLTDLAIGDRIKFGTIYGKPIVWLVADKNHVGYPSNSVTLLSEKIIKLLCFDAREPTNTESDRQGYGNNRYLHSNIRQWLNSMTAAGAWYTAQHTYDAPPSQSYVNNGSNEYDDEPGFLYALTTVERAAILNTPLTVAKNNVSDGGGSETVTDKVFLLSNTEVGVANENGIAEGSLLTLFGTASNRLGYPTADAISNSEYTNSNLKTTLSWNWWLRTPYVADTRHARIIIPGGGIDDNGENSNYGHDGLRPALNLSGTLSISITTDADGCYTLT